MITTLRHQSDDDDDDYKDEDDDVDETNFCGYTDKKLRMDTGIKN